MFEYTLNEPAVLHVRLLDVNGVPVLGVTNDAVSLTVEQADGAVASLVVDNGAGASWAEVVTGAFAGQGKYDLTLPAGTLSRKGPLVFAVKSGRGSAMGIINVVDAVFDASDRAAINDVQAKVDKLPLDPSSDTHVDAVLAATLGQVTRPDITLVLTASGLSVSTVIAAYGDTSYAVMTRVTTGHRWDAQNNVLSLTPADTHIDLTETPSGSRTWGFTRNFSSLPDDTYRFEFLAASGSPLANSKTVFLKSGVPTVTSLTDQMPLNHNYGMPDAFRYTDLDGNPISGAIVRVYTAGDWAAGALASPVGATTTGPDGRWTNPIFVAPGSYAIQFHLPGQYGPDIQQVVVTAASPSTLPNVPTIPLSHNTGGVDNLAYKTAGGAPVVGATVRVFTQYDWNAGRVHSPVGTTTTDTAGRWVREVFVVPGTYVLEFELVGQVGPDITTVTV